jgi:hypothetical protein
MESKEYYKDITETEEKLQEAWTSKYVNDSTSPSQLLCTKRGDGVEMKIS